MKHSTFNFFVLLIIVIAAFVYSQPIGWLALIIAIGIFIYMGRGKVFFSLANFYAAKGEKALSFQSLKKAYETAPYEANIAIAYGYALLKKGEIDQADHIFSKMNDDVLQPQHRINLILNRSIVLWKKGEQEESIALAESLLASYKHSVIYGTLGYYYILQERWEDALRFNEEAYEFNDNDPAICDNLGWTYLMLGKVDEALPIFERLIERQPKFREAYYNAGITYEQAGQIERAYALLQQSLHHEPALISHVTDEQIKQKISELESQHPQLLEEGDDGSEAATHP